MKPILILEYSNGSLPPPYSYFYRISFFENKYAQLEFFSANNEELKEIFTENRPFEIEKVRKSISELLNDLKDDSTLNIGGEVKKIIYEKEGETREMLISPNEKSKSKIFDHLVNIYNPEFETTKEDIIEKLYNH